MSLKATLSGSGNMRATPYQAVSYIQGPPGDPGVVISPEQPTDPDVKVWIDSDGEAEYSPDEVLPHASTHAADGSDPITPAAIGAPTVEEMNAAIAAIPTPDVSGQIDTHNASETAHEDIRQLVSAAQSAAQAAQNTANSKEAAGTAASLVATHNTNTAAHEDLRNLANNAVSFAAQTLTDEQQTQARSNIGATTVDEVVDTLSGGMTLTDTATGTNYILYVSNGKLMMKEE